MKLSIKRIELLTAIAAVRPAARGSLPILNNLLVVAGPGNNVTLTASDLDLFIRVKTEAEVAKEGKTTVPAALLQDIARLTDTKEISLEVAKNAIQINCGSTKHQLVTIDPDDFPPFPRLKPQSNQKDAKEPVEFVLDDSVFRKALQEASFAASTEESRAILCGTLVKLDGKQMHVAGCDGRRLAAATLDSPVANKVTLVLPTKTVRELIRLLGADANKPQRLTVLAGENHASFTFASAYESEITIVSKLIDGQYPDYTRIIPPENAIATLPRAELLRCVERIALVADDVNLEFNGSALHLRSQGRRGTELLGEAQDSLLVPAKVKEKVEVTYAARFLGAALQSVDADALEFHLDPARRLGLFKVPGRGWLSVIAPCKKENGNGAPAKPAPAPAATPAAPAAPAGARPPRPRVMVSKPTTAAPAPAPAPGSTGALPAPATQPAPTQPEQAS
jgi:DNA polymerase-3 subunit beta